MMQALMIIAALIDIRESQRRPRFYGRAPYSLRFFSDAWLLPFRLPSFADGASASASKILSHPRISLSPQLSSPISGSPYHTGESKPHGESRSVLGHEPYAACPFAISPLQPIVINWLRFCLMPDDAGVGSRPTNIRHA